MQALQSGTTYPSIREYNNSLLTRCASVPKIRDFLKIIPTSPLGSLCIYPLPKKKSSPHHVPHICYTCPRRIMKALNITGTRGMSSARMVPLRFQIKTLICRRYTHIYIYTRHTSLIKCRMGPPLSTKCIPTLGNCRAYIASPNLPAPFSKCLSRCALRASLSLSSVYRERERKKISARGTKVRLCVRTSTRVRWTG